MRRKLFVAVVILILGVVAVALIKSAASRDQVKIEGSPEGRDAQQPNGGFEREAAAQGSASGIESKLGRDDGFVATIFYGGDIMGNLEVCG